MTASSNRVYLDTIRVHFDAAPAWAALAWAGSMMIGMTTIITIVLTGRFVDAILHGLEAGMDELVLLAAVGIGRTVGESFVAGIALPILSYRVTSLCARKTLLTVTGPPDIRHLVDSEFQANLRNSQGRLSVNPGSTALTGPQLVAPLVTIVGVLALLWTLPLLVVAALVVTAGWHIRARSPRQPAQRDEPGAGVESRRADYLLSTALRPAEAREIRVFGLAPWITNQFAKSLAAVARITTGQMARPAVGIVLPVLARFFATVAGLVIIVLRLRDGDLDPGKSVILIEALIVLSTYVGFGESAMTFRQGAEAIRAGNLMAWPTTAAEPRRERHHSPPTGQPHLEFDDVTFSYPAATSPVLQGLTLSVSPGEVVAFVGPNGAGKSTLFKLLLGLLEPTSGTIRIDGIDIADLDINQWRANCGVAFQNGGRFPFSVIDNVLLGKDGGHDDVERLLHQVGLSAMLDRLPNGLDTILSRQCGGVDLSGGEWQRLALARAIAHTSPKGALLLDEPLAELDPTGEQALFSGCLSRFPGVTRLVVTHRLSTARLIGRTVVIDGGRVVEDGFHDSLIACNDVYARMFRLQAQRFAAPSGDA